MKTEEDHQVAASRIEEREALREKAHEAVTPPTLCARKAEEEGAKEGKEPPAEVEEEEENAREMKSRRRAFIERAREGELGETKRERGPEKEKQYEKDKVTKHEQYTIKDPPETPTKSAKERTQKERGSGLTEDSVVA